MGLKERLQAQRLPSQQLESSSVEIQVTTPVIMEDMLQILREVGLPSMLIGAFRHALKGVSDDDARGICARVGVGMFAICNGMPVREALSPDTLLDDDVMANIMVALKGGSLSLDIPTKRALEAGGGRAIWDTLPALPGTKEQWEAAALEAGGVEAGELWEEVNN